MSVSFEVSLSGGGSMPDAHGVNVARADSAPITEALRAKQTAGCRARASGLASDPLGQNVDRHAEDVAGAALGGDVLRPDRIALDLAPEPEDLAVDRAIEDLGAVQPRQI